MTDEMGNMLEPEETSSFNSHQLHVFALYDDLRRSGDVKTMLDSTVLQRILEAQSLEDRSEYGEVTGEDIAFCMKNFKALIDCRNSVILRPKLPPPPLKKAAPKKRKRKELHPITKACNKLRRKGYSTKDKGGDKYFIVSAAEMNTLDTDGSVRVAFKGSLGVLKTSLDNRYVVVKDEEEGFVSLTKNGGRDDPMVVDEAPDVTTGVTTGVTT